jgi:hypothetical protein
MRISSAWAKMAIENTGLKSALICLTIVSIILSVLLLEANGKEPLIIERACYSKAMEVVGSQQSKEEIENFIRIALSQRFDSDIKANDFLEAELQNLKSKEQAELMSRQMKQFLHLNSLAGDHGIYSVDSDRVISVGAVRSALRFPLKVQIAAVSRTTGNPYGLLLTNVEQIKESKGEK